MGKKLQPKLRFRGFTDAWEQRPFGKVYTRCTERNNPIRFGVDKIITVASMQYAPRHGCTNNEYLLTYNVMKLGDIAFEGNRNKRFPFGRFVENMIGEGIVSHVFSVYRPIVKQSSLLFLKYYINNDYVIRNMLRKSTIAATMMRTLVDADLMRQTLTLPSGREQEKIGKLFVDIDNLIDAEKRKLNLLKDKKTALLRQIFDQKARFKGYTDPWEPRRLGEICSFKKGQGYSKKDTCDSGTPLLLYGQMYTNYATAVTSADAYTTPHPHSVYSTGKEVIVPSSGETQEDIAVASAVLEPGIIYGGDINILTPPDYLNPVFLALTISGGPAHRRLAERAQGKTIVHLRNLDIAQVDIALPEESEQVRIAELFMGLDNLIDAESRKIDLLELKKKALLQQMFV